MAGRRNFRILTSSQQSGVLSKKKIKIQPKLFVELEFEFQQARCPSNLCVRNYPMIIALPPFSTLSFHK